MYIYNKSLIQKKKKKVKQGSGSIISFISLPHFQTEEQTLK